MCLSLGTQVAARVQTLSDGHDISWPWSLSIQSPRVRPHIPTAGASKGTVSKGVWVIGVGGQQGTVGHIPGPMPAPQSS